jgi:hypothetical protein
VNISPAFARNGVLLMWLGSIAIVAYKEFGNQSNPGRPLPRPCKLIPGAIGYTGLGLLAELMPPIAFLVALGITVGEIVWDAGTYGAASTILYQLSGSIRKETAQVGATP